jgi:hypothetical protein
MSNYTSNAINYYRVNANNTAIANSNLGATGNQPTEEIAAPLPSPGTFSSYSTAGGLFTITGSGTANFNLFAVNQYLYYTDSISGEYVLVGQIATINISGLTLTLTSAAVNTPTASSVLSAAYSLITSNESIYMRIETNTSSAPPNQMFIPDFGVSKWRQSTLTGRNIPQQSALERVSYVGTPLSSDPVIQDIPFTFVTMNQFTVAQSGGAGGTAQVTTYFPSLNSLPTYIWIRVTPEIGTSTSLSSQTLYRFTTQENTPAIAIFAQTPITTLSNAGYSNLGTAVGGGGPGTGSN